jgi:aspartyl-tRNA(Asn)/glutamyl-tRNA(Gln) amidotransferase subunit B
MISSETRDKYSVAIGIECHVQLKTATKLFAAVGNDARGADPNTLISHICLGMPGALPVLNEKAVELASRMAFALNVAPQAFSKFDRKHYFYPDLPKGYQISQYEQPIVLGGYVDIEAGSHKKRIGITRAHLEEDAGKNSHPAGADYSLVDLNRAGTPLLEIVSEPDIHSPAEAKAYVRELYLLAKYADVSDADLYHGNMRFDVNVSVSKEAGKLGTRTETKNLNSFKSVEKAAEYEISRQIELLEKGEKIAQETRGWDDAKQKTTSQRGKEEAHDYRYMPEPDLPPTKLSKEFIEVVKASMPIMPGEWRERLASLGLSTSQIDTLLEAEVEDERFSYLALIEQHLDDKNLAKFLANWFTNLEIPLRRDEEASTDIKDAEREEIYLGAFALAKANKLSSTNTKLLLADLLKEGIVPEHLEKYAEEKGYIQVSDEGEIAKVVGLVIKENPGAAEDVKKGEMKAIGFLVGQVMQKSGGKANPALAQQLIRKRLGV